MDHRVDCWTSRAEEGFIPHQLVHTASETDNSSGQSHKWSYVTARRIAAGSAADKSC